MGRRYNSAASNVKRHRQRTLDLLAAKKLSSVELTQYLWSVCQRFNPKLNAFTRR